MHFTVKLEGVPEHILEEIIHKGFAQNKTDAIRMALFALNEKYIVLNNKQLTEEAAIDKKFYEIKAEHKDGKTKKWDAYLKAHPELKR